jgi:diguanylate cyclase (GGDEF)-like protein
MAERGTIPKPGATTRVHRASQTLARAAARAESCLVTIHGPDLGRRHTLERSEIVLGRDEDCDVVVALDDASRHHCRLRVDAAGVRVADLGSTNGTYVNEHEVLADTEVMLRSGDFLRVGGAVYKFLQGGNLEALYHEEIYRTLIVDGLTQISNRRYLLEFLDREISRCVRHDRPLALVLFDIDHFKRVNDMLGHLAGDEVLRLVAARLRPKIRREDCFARFGGEEFAVVPLESTLRGALDLGEKIRASIASAPFTAEEGVQVDVTVSVGVAERGDARDAQALIRRVDEQLYRAKTAGRNRVVG